MSALPRVRWFGRCSKSFNERHGATRQDSNRTRIVEFTHDGGAVERTRVRVETQVACAVRLTGSARLLEVATSSGAGATTLWQSFVLPGPHQLAITHVAVVTTLSRTPEHAPPAASFPHVAVQIFDDIDSARCWLRESP